MEKRITKKQFIETLQKGNHVFFGCIRREATTDELQLAIDNFIKESGIVEERSVKEAHTTYLLFNNESRLLLNQKGNNNFYIMEYAGYILLSFIREYVNSWNETDIHACYYLMKNA